MKDDEDNLLSVYSDEVYSNFSLELNYVVLFSVILFFIVSDELILVFCNESFIELREVFVFLFDISFDDYSVGFVKFGKVLWYIRWYNLVWNKRNNVDVMKIIVWKVVRNVIY